MVPHHTESLAEFDIDHEIGNWSPPFSENLVNLLSSFKTLQYFALYRGLYSNNCESSLFNAQFMIHVRRRCASEICSSDLRKNIPQTGVAHPPYAIHSLPPTDAIYRCSPSFITRVLSPHPWCHHWEPIWRSLCTFFQNLLRTPRLQTSQRRDCRDIFLRPRHVEICDTRYTIEDAGWLCPSTHTGYGLGQYPQYMSQVTGTTFW